MTKSKRRQAFTAQISQSAWEIMKMPSADLGRAAVTALLDWLTDDKCTFHEKEQQGTRALTFLLACDHIRAVDNGITSKFWDPVVAVEQVQSLNRQQINKFRRDMKIALDLYKAPDRVIVLLSSGMHLRIERRQDVTLFWEIKTWQGVARTTIGLLLYEYRADVRVCKGCGRVFLGDLPRRGPKNRYCTVKCGQRARQKRCRATLNVG